MVKPPKASQARVQPWTHDQVDAVRAWLPARYQALADVGAGLGMRQGEIFGLAVEDIDFLRRVVHVRRQVSILGTAMTFARPKAARSGTYR
jgi:integrase